MADDDEHEGATYRSALDDLGDLPPSKADPYAGVVARFGQLPVHVRLFLQRLSPRDIGTLAALIINTQRAGASLRFIKRGVTWGVIAFGAAVALGKQIEEVWTWAVRFLR